MIEKVPQTVYLSYNYCVPMTILKSKPYIKKEKLKKQIILSTNDAAS